MNSLPKAAAQTATIYPMRPEGRIGHDVAGTGPLVVLVPGMGDLRAACRFLAPALREAGYRVAWSPAANKRKAPRSGAFL